MDEATALKVLDALAQAARLRAFKLILATGADGLGNAEIAAALGITKSTASRHLAALVNAGLLTDRREGRHVRYCAVEDRPVDALHYVTKRGR